MPNEPLPLGQQSLGQFQIVTLGCKANIADSDQLTDNLEAVGWARWKGSESPELIIINSCSVTDEADRQSLRAAKRAKKDHPTAKVVFTGCGADVKTDRWVQSGSIDAVIGNRFKLEAHKMITDHTDWLEPQVLGGKTGYDELQSRHPEDREWPLPILQSQASSMSEREHTRAFVKVQEGCNAFCTFCIIPYGRGPARSLSIQKIVEHVDGLVASGVRECVLAATNLGDYQDPSIEPHSGDLTSLVKAILQKTKLERLRLGSLDPSEVRAELWDLLGREPRLCPHVHLSLQHTDDGVLRRMKRRYHRVDVESFFARAQEASMERKAHCGQELFVGIDLIMGFPGETDQNVEDLIQLLDRSFWTRLHVFPYSERAGTPATRLGQSVPVEVRKSRTRLLNRVSLNRQWERMHARVGDRLNLLTESKVKGPDQSGRWIFGYSPDYCRLLLRESPEKSIPRSQILSVTAVGTFIDRAAQEVSLIVEEVSS